MAITSLGSHAFLPTLLADPFTAGSIGSLSGLLLNASSDKIAFVFKVPKTGTLDKAEFRLDAVSNNPDNGLKCSFQDIDNTTGFPDGSADQFRVLTGAPLTTGWQAPGLMTSDGTDLGSKRSVTIGQDLAFVVEFSSFVASDSVQVGLWIGASGHILETCYVGDANTGTYAKSGTGIPNFVLKYDDGTYEIPMTGSVPTCANTFINTNVSTSTTPDEVALRFQLPFGFRVVGAWMRGDPNDNFDLVLYSGTTAERTCSFDIDIIRAAVPGFYFGNFSSSYTCSANTTYRIAFKPTTTTNGSVHRFTTNSTAICAAIPGGAQWYESTRVDAGAWSDTDTNQPWMGIIVDGFDVSAAGGSGGSFPFVG